MTNPQTALMAAMQAGHWTNKEILDTAEVFLEWLNIEDEKVKPKPSIYSPRRVMGADF